MLSFAKVSAGSRFDWIAEHRQSRLSPAPMDEVLDYASTAMIKSGSKPTSPAAEQLARERINAYNRDHLPYELFDKFG